MSFFTNKIKGLDKRWRCYHYGLLYWRNSDFKISDHLHINGVRFHLKLSYVNRDEFSSICLFDGYKLRLLKKQLKIVNNIVDIGANHGLFLIAARQNFPNAEITCYEPNKILQNSLSYNARELHAEVHYEAVTKNDCTVKLTYCDSDLATTTSVSDAGDVKGTSLKTLIQRAGGRIDILKMDCEGAEWALLEDSDSFKDIIALTMEYHLSEKCGRNLQRLNKLIAHINFTIISETILSNDQGIIVALNKN